MKKDADVQDLRDVKNEVVVDDVGEGRDAHEIWGRFFVRRNSEENEKRFRKSEVLKQPNSKNWSYSHEFVQELPYNIEWQKYVRTRSSLFKSWKFFTKVFELLWT